MHNKKFKHIIITRFNVKVDKHSMAPSKTWFESRLIHFNSVCLPSVTNQTNKEFLWLIFIDIDTDSIELDILISKYKYIKLVRIPFWELELVQDKIRNEMSGCNYLITTRLDNDDAIAINFIEKIQDEFDCQNQLFINFDNGIIFDQLTQKLYARNSYVNSWVSLIESVFENKFNTVFLEEHHLIYKKYCVKRISGEPMWLMNVHGGNIANSIRKRHFIVDRNLITRFGKLNLQCSNYKTFTFENIERYVYHLAFIISRPLVKSIRKFI